MKRNYICILGALPIGITGYIWKSKTMILSSIVGVIFHTNPNNQMIKYIDLSLNIVLSCKGALYDNNIMWLVIFSGTCYILNSFVYDVRNHTRYIACNIAHVLFIQMVGLYGYYLLYKHEPCIEFYYVCEDNMINY